MRSVLILLFVIFSLPSVGAEAVQIDFFYEPGCYDCERIEETILPEVEKRFPKECVIRRHDIGIETNFLYLLQLEDAAGHTGTDRAYLIVNKQFLFGPNPSHEEFLSLISDLLEEGRALSPKAPRTARRAVPTQKEDLAEERFNGFTVGAVILAGLLDGMNPCAISTLVFFMSLLAVSKVRKRELLLLGASFCLASFLTYLALGFGLFRVLHLFSGFTVLRSAVEWGMAAVLLILALLSFRDAVRFRKSHDGHDVTLQLSTGMKKRIHNVMRRGLELFTIKTSQNPPRPAATPPEEGNPNARNHSPLQRRGAGTAGWVLRFGTTHQSFTILRTGHLVLGGLFIGAAVTALESVCTGQVYVPTLVLILKNNALAESRAWLYLLAYNLLFILPLVLAFIAVYFGLRTETLLRWSGQNVVLSKILLGLFFILMIFAIFCF